MFASIPCGKFVRYVGDGRQRPARREIAGETEFHRCRTMQRVAGEIGGMCSETAARTARTNVSLLLSLLLAFLPIAVSAQINPCVAPVQILGIFDPAGTRLGMIVVADRSGRGFEAGNEYWSFSEKALLGMAELESLELANLAVGEWGDPWIEEALDWRPADTLVAWNHPAEIEWTAQDDMLPPVVAGSSYFGNATLGGLTIQYSERGPASLTWFKTTEGAFMQLEDGALFTRDDKAPSTGSWWHGPIVLHR